ncbi:MAG: amidohydrolase family protein [Porticoccaceae bacterium]|nr:amidohydrolase family protein [Porticoccaceae bacterium]
MKCLIAFLSTLLILASTASANPERFIVEKSPTIAFVNARVIDGSGKPAQQNQTVIIRDGRIIKIGGDGTLEIPKDAKRISLRGKSLLPGWVMTHEHMHYITRSTRINDGPAIGISVANTTFSPQSVIYPRLYLSAGVTTARTAGSVYHYTDLRVKRAIAAGELVGPDLDLTVGLDYVGSVVRDPEHARRQVRFWAGEGMTSVKLFEEITPEQAAAAIDEAHQHGLKVTGHLCATTLREAVDLGIDHIEHGLSGLVYDYRPLKKAGLCPKGTASVDLDSLNPGNKRVQALIQHIIDNNVFVTSTLPVFFREPLPDNVAAWLNESGLRDYQHYQQQQQKRKKSPKGNQLGQVAMALEAAFWRAGGQLTVGSDAAGTGVLAGYDNLRALELLVEAGIPPMEVIKIATHNGAVSIDLLDDRGTIAVGKRADLLIIGGNPDVDIKDIQQLETVFKNGIGYDVEALRKSAIGTIGGPG